MKQISILGPILLFVFLKIYIRRNICSQIWFYPIKYYWMLLNISEYSHPIFNFFPNSNFYYPAIVIYCKSKFVLCNIASENFEQSQKTYEGGEDREGAGMRGGRAKIIKAREQEDSDSFGFGSRDSRSSRWP